MLNLAQWVSVIFGLGICGFSVAFGLYAGFQAAWYFFGPVNIGVKVNDINLRHAPQSSPIKERP